MSARIQNIKSYRTLSLCGVASVSVHLPVASSALCLQSSLAYRYGAFSDRKYDFIWRCASRVGSTGVYLSLPICPISPFRLLDNMYALLRSLPFPLLSSVHSLSTTSTYESRKDSPCSRLGERVEFVIPRRRRRFVLWPACSCLHLFYAYYIYLFYYYR